MPLPNPKPRESEKDFISRFMSDKKMIEEFPNSKQRYAVCMSVLEKNEDISLFIEKLDI